MKKFWAIFLAVLFCVPLVACGGGSVKKEEFTVSFAQKSGTLPQNVKKFDMFTSDWTWAGTSPGAFDEEMRTVVPNTRVSVTRSAG